MSDQLNTAWIACLHAMRECEHVFVGYNISHDESHEAERSLDGSGLSNMVDQLKEVLCFYRHVTLLLTQNSLFVPHEAEEFILNLNPHLIYFLFSRKNKAIFILTKLELYFMRTKASHFVKT